MNGRTARLLHRQSVLTKGPWRARRLKRLWNKLPSPQRAAARAEMVRFQHEN